MKLNIVKAVSIAGLVFISQLAQAAPPTVDPFVVGQPLTAAQMNTIKAFLEYNESNIVGIKSGPTTTVNAGPPSVSNDINWSYVVGSVWVDTVGGEAYILTDSTSGEAVWKLITYAPTVYAIGDTGPAGGIVFYVTNNGVHGLEAAPADLVSATWGCVSVDIARATGTAVGTGATNTAAIVAGCADTAAKVANAFTLNTYSDWFLPSKDELNELYINRVAVGGFSNGYYWSSSQFAVGDAWSQFFDNGSQSGASKNFVFGVRAVRAF